ncbi:MAG TPA: hypothetical protein VJY64_00120 [Candidatus Onthovivens sp.]|nr:hypothetical protein [Candidatus Onthovivens sp.]
MKLSRKLTKIISNIVFYTMLAFASIVCFFSAINGSISFLNFEVATVGSASMVASGYEVGEKVIVNNLGKEYQVGDVVVFEKFNKLWFHEIISIEDGVIQTKGSSNPNPDPFTITASDIQGYDTKLEFGWIFSTTSVIVIASVFYVSFMFSLLKEGKQIINNEIKEEKEIIHEVKPSKEAKLTRLDKAKPIKTTTLALAIIVGLSGASPMTILYANENISSSYTAPELTYKGTGTNDDLLGDVGEEILNILVDANDYPALKKHLNINKHNDYYFIDSEDSAIGSYIKDIVAEEVEEDTFSFRIVAGYETINNRIYYYLDLYVAATDISKLSTTRDHYLGISNLYSSKKGVFNNQNQLLKDAENFTKSKGTVYSTPYMVSEPVYNVIDHNQFER